MATYNELRSLYGDGSLKNRVEVAVCVKAHAVIQEATPTATRIAWAKAALQNPAGEADYLLKYALAANAALTLAQIQSAADSALLTVIGAAADKFYP